jgi:hypothetical protein
MSETCSMHKNMRNSFKFKPKNLEARCHVGDVGIGERMVLKCILNGI